MYYSFSMFLAYCISKFLYLATLGAGIGFVIQGSSYLGEVQASEEHLRFQEQDFGSDEGTVY